MSKVITFSRTFPSYHPKKGQSTHFVEKYLNQRMGSHWKYPMYLQELADLNPNKPFSLIEEFYYSLDFSITETKCHTIRAGHRWEAGQNFSPRVWSGRPYHSPQIIFAHDIELKKVWEFGINEKGTTFINHKMRAALSEDEQRQLGDNIEIIARNDGLSVNDFSRWFQYPKQFKGQILCWDERINY